MLIDQRVNLKRIQTLMGHRNIQTTLNVYGHLIERAETASRQPDKRSQLRLPEFLWHICGVTNLEL